MCNYVLMWLFFRQKKHLRGLSYTYDNVFMIYIPFKMINNCVDVFIIVILPIYFEFFGIKTPVKLVLQLSKNLKLLNTAPVFGFFILACNPHIVRLLYLQGKQPFKMPNKAEWSETTLSSTEMT